jgi:Ran GTPase-activating protein (RanGAP) involved in mRNA processing and transport
MNIGTRSDVLFDALTSNTYVRTLNLASNEIDDDVISSLSVALMDNTSIKYINLSDNFLTSEGAECKYYYNIVKLIDRDP